MVGQGDVALGEVDIVVGDDLEINWLIVKVAGAVT
jgi:hypothetical protein